MWYRLQQQIVGEAEKWGPLPWATCKVVLGLRALWVEGAAGHCSISPV